MSGNSIIFDGQPVEPGKILCVGRNYVEHIEELGNEVPDDMVLFCKPNTAIADVLASEHDEPLHYEAELCFLVRGGRYVGVGIGLDLTKRGLQGVLKRQGLPWERAKAFDGSATFSYFVPVPENLNQLSFSLHIDDQLTQQGEPAKMMYSPETILLESARFMTLNDNDVVMTGTPVGVGQVTPGARFVGRVFYQHEPIIEHCWIGQDA